MKEQAEELAEVEEVTAAIGGHSRAQQSSIRQGGGGHQAQCLLYSLVPTSN